jgi:nucleoside-diphosphate-sugar epimerase
VLEFDIGQACGGRAMYRVAVFGAGGFVGRACVAALEDAGHDVRPRPAPRLLADRDGLTRRAAPDTATIAESAHLLSGCDAVVNAAGVAIATSRATRELYGANAAWPYLLAHACRNAGVRRLVHVSTAAVQGRAATLDESQSYAPVNPYADAKALGERLLLRFAALSAPELVVYRPPSVHGAGRDRSRSFAAFARRWPLVVCGAGDQPVPVALVGNVGAVAAALVAAPDPPTIVTHPNEGYAVRSLYETFAPGRRIRSVPGRPVHAALRLAEPVGRVLPPVAALSRRAELLLVGQEQAPSWLDTQGFTLPLGHADWNRVAELV